jgi:hypothetical protein
MLVIDSIRLAAISLKALATQIRCSHMFEGGHYIARPSVVASLEGSVKSKTLCLGSMSRLQEGSDVI